MLKASGYFNASGHNSYGEERGGSVKNLSSPGREAPWRANTGLQKVYFCTADRPISSPISRMRLTLAISGAARICLLRFVRIFFTFFSNTSALLRSM
jgi:hypothetical protein